MVKNLISLFARSANLRAGSIAIVITTFVLMNLIYVFNGLRNGPDLDATETLGRADYVITLPASAPLATTDPRTQANLAQIVRRAGGTRVTTEYVIPQIRPDLSTPYRYELLESTDRTFTYPSMRLVSGKWPSSPGQAVVSTQGILHFSDKTHINFFAGAMRLHIVGTFINDISRTQNAVVLAPGTWEGLPALSASRLRTLDASATRSVYWSGGAPQDILSSVSNLARNTLALKGAAEFNPPQLQTRKGILGIQLAPVPQIQLATVLAPLLAGMFVGILAGRFVSRTRRIMWATGIGLSETRTAALLAVIGVSFVASILGVGISLVLLPVTLSIADLGSTHTLSAQTGVEWAAGGVISGVTVGSLLGCLVVSPRLRSTNHQRLARVANVRLLATVAFIGLVCLGFISVQSSTDPASISIAGLAFSAAALIALLGLFSILLRVEPRSLVMLLAIRRVREDSGGTIVLAYLIGFLGVTGVALSIYLTSSYAAINSGSVSLVPKGQIVLAPELAQYQQNVALAAEFRQQLQLGPPVVENSADQGSERGDGATAVVNTPEEVAQVTGTHLSGSDRRLLLNGGALTSHTADSNLTVFVPIDDFAGATLKSRFLAGANLSFARWDSIILTDTAVKVGLHPIAPAFVFTDTTPYQRAQVANVVAQLGIKQSWVQTYRAPDLATASAAYLFASGALVALTALVSYFVAILDSRSLLQSARTLLAVGVGRRFIAGVMAAKTVLVVVVATVAGLIASILGSQIAFSFGRLKVPLIVPIPQVVLEIVITLVVSGLAALWATRRVKLRSSSRPAA